MKILVTFAVILATATAVLAHSGVKDRQVMARMNLMSMIAEDMKVLGGMTKGTLPFDTNLAGKHADNLAGHARQIDVLFKEKATDPKSEARDEIWSDWAGFSKVTDEMEAAALALGDAQDLSTFEDAFAALGKTCTACHKDYRIKKN